MAQATSGVSQGFGDNSQTIGGDSAVAVALVVALVLGLLVWLWKGGK